MEAGRAPEAGLRSGHASDVSGRVLNNPAQTEPVGLHRCSNVFQGNGQLCVLLCGFLFFFSYLVISKYASSQSSVRLRTGPVDFLQLIMFSIVVDTLQNNSMLKWRGKVRVFFERLDRAAFPLQCHPRGCCAHFADEEIFQR